MNTTPAMPDLDKTQERDLLDEEGENLAVRSFLMQYSCDRSIAVGAMLAHMSRSGWRGTAPKFALDVRPETHLTKAGAQIWIRHLISLEAQTARSLPPLQVGVGSVDTPEFRELLAQTLDAAEAAEKANDPSLYLPARTALIAYIDARQVAPESAKGLTEAMHRDHATSCAAMEFAANLCRLDVETIKGRDYVPREAVMNEVVAWRKAFDAAPAVDYRAYLAQQGAQQ